MRFSHLLLPLALLFSIGSCAEHLLTGTWSNSIVRNRDMSVYCCVPYSIKIEEAGGSTLKATYKYDSSYVSSGANCNKLFGTEGYSNPSGQLTINNFTTVTSEKYIADVTSRGSMQFWFDVKYEYTSKYPNLNVYTYTGDSSKTCNFTMTIREGKGFFYLFKI